MRFLGSQLAALENVPLHIKSNMWENSHADRLTMLAGTMQALGRGLSTLEEELRVAERSKIFSPSERESIQNVRIQAEELTETAWNLTIFLSQMLERRGEEGLTPPQQTNAEMKAERGELIDAVRTVQSETAQLKESIIGLRDQLHSNTESQASVRRTEVRIDIDRYRRDNTA